MPSLVTNLLNYLKSSESPYAVFAGYALAVQAYAVKAHGSIANVNIDQWIVIGVVGVGVLLYSNHLEKKVPPEKVKEESDKLIRAVSHLYKEVNKLKEGKS